MSETQEQPDFDVDLRLRELPASVVQARLERTADDAANEKIAQPRIEAQLGACQLVRQGLEREHSRIADVTDLDLTGYSRGAALWLLSGRCLGLLRALLIQVRAGVCTESLVTGRAIHEATAVLRAFRAPQGEEVVRVWLDDAGRHGYVKQRAAREAQDAYETALDDAMQRAGVPPVGRTTALMDELYDRLSQTAHNRRNSCIDAVWQRGREMAYGVHSSPIRRAGYAEWTSSVTVDVANSVGDALAGFHERGFFSTTIVPLIKSIEAIRHTARLDERDIRQAAGTL